jgi:hypothetical protein
VSGHEYIATVLTISALRCLRAAAFIAHFSPHVTLAGLHSTPAPPRPV